MELASNILVLVGLLMFLGSAFFRRPGTPFASVNPRHWIPIWRPEFRQRLRPPGFAILWVGYAVFSIGLALRWLPRWLG
jgi:hypothetical protein